MLTLGFFFVAVFYASVGFGGGSSYLALLSTSGINYTLIPKIGLICNLAVVSGGCWHYWREGHFNKKLIFPFVLSSVPMAFLGGLYPIKEKTFLMLLAGSLFFAGVRLLFIPKQSLANPKRPPFVLALIVGAFLGFLSGLVGIGGGIFLSPLMLNCHWGRPKEVAAVASSFILLNSFSGLIGQMIKGYPGEIFQFWPLLIVVIIGGQIGSRFGSHRKVPEALIQRGTAILILFISGRLILKVLDL